MVNCGKGCAGEQLTGEILSGHVILQPVEEADGFLHKSGVAGLHNKGETGGHLPKDEAVSLSVRLGHLLDATELVKRFVGLQFGGGALYILGVIIT